MQWPKAAVTAALSHARGTTVTVHRATPLHGGDINEAARLETTDGPLFLKWNRRAPAGMFRAERLGLAALAASGTRLAVPEPIVDADPTPNAPGFLVTTFLAVGRRGRDFDEELGLGLAELHRATRPEFGFTVDNFIGTTPQPNPAESRWIDFYREHRLRFQARLAHRHGRLCTADMKQFDRLLDSLDQRLIDGPPALLHGDLWSGNLHQDGDRPALIDPATYYGHPEAELGMMTLFGGFSERTLAAYAAASDLQSDWRERQPLYQLYHILNHANLFGGGYGAQAMRIVGRYVDA